MGAAIAGQHKAFKRFPNLPGSDPQLLARFGATVRAKLNASPAASKVPALNLEIYEVRNFVSVDECAHLIALIEADVKPSTLLSDHGNGSIRTSQTCKLPGSHPVVAGVEHRIAELLGLPLSHSETVQGQRYSAGQEFKIHNDYFAGGQTYSEIVSREGGQRTWTAMVYLNRPEVGGATSFPRALARIDPSPGTLLTWNNNNSEGLSNPWSHHQGTLVEAGVKYILTKWFRERAWKDSQASEVFRV
jgi:prolyl 4-hydroxylase